MKKTNFYNRLMILLDRVLNFIGEKLFRIFRIEFKSLVRLSWNMHIVLRDEFGNIKKQQWIHNTVTTAGKAGVMDQLLASPSLNKPTHMAIGTGSPSGTALGTELDRNALTSKTRSGAVVTMVGDWAAGDGTGTLTEAGIFDAASTGNMYTSATIAFTKGASDTLSISWTLTGA